MSAICIMVQTRCMRSAVTVFCPSATNLSKYACNGIQLTGSLLYTTTYGISQSDLVTVYISVVRPVGLLEYDCPVWHTNSQQYLSDIYKDYLRRICLIEFISTTTTSMQYCRLTYICKKNTTLLTRIIVMLNIQISSYS